MERSRSCREKSCQHFNVQYYNSPKFCRSCGNEMFDDEVQESAINTEFEFEFTPELMTEIQNYKGKNVTPIIVKHNDVFKCAPDVKGCPIAKNPTVYIPMDMFNKWIYLAGQFDTEWIAYLKGHVVEGTDFDYEITEMYFPKQEGSPAECEAEDGEIQDETVAAVHSHVGMNVFFSTTDENHFNHNIELVVNNKGEILATGRTKLECGRWHRGPADIQFTNCDEELELEEQLKSQLTVKKYTNYTNYSQQKFPIAGLN